MKTIHLNDSIILIIVILGLSLASCRVNEPTESNIKDMDGNVYGFVKIGTQTWLDKDLRTTKYNNGELVPNVTDSSGWRLKYSEAYCWYKNDSYLNQASLGALYNYFVVVDNRKICPAGWHVPTINEWSTLINFLGGDSIAGGRLKEKGTEHWATPNKYASDEFGFTALPGGFRSSLGKDGYIGFAGNWWSSTEDATIKAWSFYTGFNDGYAGTTSSLKKNGFSIRCIKDF